MLDGIAHPPRRSERCDAKLDISHADTLALHVNGTVIYAFFERVEMSVGVGSLPTKIRFPNGWQFITETSDELDLYLLRKGKRSVIGRLEKNISTILMSSAILILLIVSMFTHGIPWLTQQVVNYLPSSVPKFVEVQVLESLDEHLFEPSELPSDRRQSIRLRFERQLEQMKVDGGAQLVFRSSELGANAFALSGGTIVVLDDLVHLTQTQEQLDSILMHEFGHVQHQHAMKALVRSSLLSFTVAALTGESSGVIDNLTGLGVFVANNGQSQDAEREADLVASELMIQLHGSNQAMIEMFELLRGESNGHGDMPAWLSSHPDLTQRIDSLKAVN